jgi:hypothetical protein
MAIPHYVYLLLKMQTEKGNLVFVLLVELAIFLYQLLVAFC